MKSKIFILLQTSLYKILPDFDLPILFWVVNLWLCNRNYDSFQGRGSIALVTGRVSRRRWVTLTLTTGAGCYGSFIPSFYPSCYQSWFCCFYTVQRSFFICITTDTTLERLITMTFGTEQGRPLQRHGTPREESGMVQGFFIMKGLKKNSIIFFKICTAYALSFRYQCNIN